MISGGNHASKLVERIKADKELLIKDGKIKKDKPFPQLPTKKNYLHCRRGGCGVGWVKLFMIYQGMVILPKRFLLKHQQKSLKLGATTYGVFDRDEYKYVADDIPKESVFWLEPGDILIQRSNSIDYVGVSAIYTGESKEFIYPDLMMKIRIARPLSISLLHLFLSSPVTRGYFRAKAKGSQQTMPKN